MIPQPACPKRSPRIVATGFTTALLGDERTLREFVVGDSVVREMCARGEPAVLYLINDSYDPLNERQLRIGVRKDARLIEQFRSFCGRPIAEIPDPFGCHASYAEHFACELIERLRTLDIHPVLLDTYQAYQAGHYAPFIRRTFDSYAEIQEQLEARFGYPPRNLFRVACPRCRAIDATTITDVGEVVTYRCARCDIETKAAVQDLRGKLSWKLDCAARWNLYGIDTETFAKAHLAETGTFSVSCFVSRRWFGSHVPAAVEYGHLRIGPDVAGRLLDVLPPAAFKQLLLQPLSRDLLITSSSLQHFAHGYEIRPGVSYAKYVRDELPTKAVELAHDELDGAATSATAISRRAERALVAHANAYSELVLGRRHALRLPDRVAIENAPRELVAGARDAIAIAIATRQAPSDSDKQVRSRLRQALKVRPMPGVYAFLRKVLVQEHGPHVPTLLAIVPPAYLALLHWLLTAAAERNGSGGSQGETDASSARKAA